MQHINLVSQLDRYIEPPFSVRLQLRLLVILLVAGLLLAFSVYMANADLEKELQQLRQQQQLGAADLTVLQARKQALQNNPQLDAEITGLERSVAFRRKMLSSIDPDESGAGRNFSEHLTGLARQHIDGLWLTQIEFQDNGQQLALQGKTRQPEFVPQFLRNLAKEPVFAGQQFKVLRMNVPKEWQGALDFEVRSEDQGARDE